MCTLAGIGSSKRRKRKVYAPQRPPLLRLLLRLLRRSACTAPRDPGMPSRSLDNVNPSSLPPPGPPGGGGGGPGSAGEPDPAPYVNEDGFGTLDLTILLKSQGGVSKFFKTAWGESPVLIPGDAAEEPTPQQRLVLSWSTLENVLAVVPPAQEPELQTGEVCESITCSAAYRDAMVAQMRPRAPQGRPAAERFFAEEAGGDLHDAILLGYQLHV